MPSPLADRLTLLLRARHPCIAINSDEEDHVLEALVKAALGLHRPIVRWSTVRGIVEGSFNEETVPIEDTQHPAGALRWWTRSSQTRILVMLDVAGHLEERVTLRAAREAIAHAQATQSTVVLIDHENLPNVIAAEAVTCEIGLPDDRELFHLAKESLLKLRELESVAISLTQADFSTMVRHLRGLPRNRAMQVLRDAAIAEGRLDARDIERVAGMKRRLLRVGGLLDAVDTPQGLADVAGLDHLKSWLAMRRPGQPGEVADPNLDPPRGILVLGIPGTGKSLSAKAIANLWNRPLMRLDAGVLYDRYVGESESRLRKALAQAEAMAPVVLWIDEVEKAFASAAAQSTDGGLSQRLFGTFLTWMQEHRSAVFTVATANTIHGLPPELLRKGRFDEIFFVDLPEQAARMELWRIHLTRRGQNHAEHPLDELASAAEGRTGTEVEQAVIAALYAARQEAVPLASRHLHAALGASPPLAVTMREAIDEMREWAVGRCVRT